MSPDRDSTAGHELCSRRAGPLRTRMTTHGPTSASPSPSSGRWYFVRPEGVPQAVLFDLIDSSPSGDPRRRPALSPRQALPWYLFWRPAFTLRVTSPGTSTTSVSASTRSSAADALTSPRIHASSSAFVQITRRLGAGQGSAPHGRADRLGRVAVPTRVFVIDPHATEVGSTSSSAASSSSTPCSTSCPARGARTPALRAGARTPAYRALVIAVGSLLAADLAYAGVSSTYDSGQWLDAVWLLSHPFWAAAALYPLDGPADGAGGRARGPADGPADRAPGGRVALAPAVLLVQELRGEPIDGIAIAVGSDSLAARAVPDERPRAPDAAASNPRAGSRPASAGRRPRPRRRGLGSRGRRAPVLIRRRPRRGAARLPRRALARGGRLLGNARRHGGPGPGRRPPPPRLARSKDYTAEYRAVRADGSMLCGSAISARPPPPARAPCSGA